VVPALFRRLAESIAEDERLDTIRIVRLGADVSDWSDFDRFRRICGPHARFMVGLSMTEGAFVHWFVNENVRATSPRLPIGRPLPDAGVTIVDEDGRETPNGEVGEIVIASRYLALGYWRDSELTARKFSIDPSDPQVRIFKTGDLACRRADGLLELAGRRDHRIKLHGHRIELGEIESALRACAGVRDAAAVVRRNAAGLPQSIVAYVELLPGATGLLPRHVSATLTQVLPRPMRPAAVFIMPELPRLASHKVDRVRIAEIDSRRPTAERSADPLVDAVAKVFETVLGVEGATAHDNLPSLGGNSLHTVDVAVSLERRFGVAVPIETFQAAQTIGELAQWIATARAGISQQPAQGPAKREVQSRHAQAPHEEAAANRTASAGDNELREADMPASDFEDAFADGRDSRFDMREISRLATEIRTSFRQQRSPAYSTQPLDKWMVAFKLMFRAGKLEVIEHGARHLYAHYPTFAYAQDMCSFFERLLPAGNQLPFRDDPTRDVQIVKRENADTALLLFCGRAHSLGMPLMASHRWLGLLPASLVYLRDFERSHYLAGVRSLGANREETLRSLRDLVRSLGAQRILCYGNSGGVFAALQYGLELGADRVLAISGMTNLSVEFNAHLRHARSTSRLDKVFPDAPKDLRQQYSAAERTPRVLLSYGEHNWDDRLHAEHLRGVPGVTLRPIDDFASHNPTMELVRRRQFQDLLDWLVAPTKCQAADAA
jgi:acyl carrier protein